jgi:hypothetical protein
VSDVLGIARGCYTSRKVCNSTDWLVGYFLGKLTASRGGFNRSKCNSRQAQARISDRPRGRAAHCGSHSAGHGDTNGRTGARAQLSSLASSLRSRCLHAPTIILAKKLLLDLYRDFVQPLLGTVSPVGLKPNVCLKCLDAVFRLSAIAIMAAATRRTSPREVIPVPQLPTSSGIGNDETASYVQS